MRNCEARTVKRLKHLTARDWLLLSEATVSLAVASAAIASLPFSRLSAWMSRPARVGNRNEAEAEAVVAKIRWAIEATAWRLPWRTVCFQKGLALHWMLQRRQLDSQLRYGVNQSAGELRAHVWVSWRGRDVIGGEGAHEFTCLAAYPPTGPRRQ